MTAPIVTLTGPPGSGKSTAGRLAADLLHLEYVSAGALFRAEAERRGWSLSRFSRYAEEHPEVDRALDDRMLSEARPDRLLEGRITGALLRRRDVATLSIVVTAPEEVRVERLAGRDHLSIAAARIATREREASERDRYLRFYGIDLSREPADLEVDSSRISAEEVARQIADFVRSRRGDLA